MPSRNTPHTPVRHPVTSARAGLAPCPGAGPQSGQDQGWSLAGDVRVEYGSRGPVLWLSGEVDAAVVDRFERRMGASPPPLAAIDAGEVTFIDCAGIEFLLRWARASSLLGTDAELRRCSPPVLRLIELLGLEHVLHPRAGRVGIA